MQRRYLVLMCTASADEDIASCHLPSVSHTQNADAEMLCLFAHLFLMTCGNVLFVLNVLMLNLSDMKW